jgi:serine/threonine protein kinase
MEYVSGQTLKEKVATEGPLTAAESQKIIESILDAVEVVHKAGMLHRDIKPDNLIISNDGRVVLIDFGSARAYSDERTIAQTAMVSPGYAPLEQYNPTARKGTFTDIYSIGATFYFMLTAEKPLNVTERYTERLKAPHEINPKVSMQVSSAVMLAMEMKAEDRFQNVGDFRMGLKQLENNEKNNSRTKISTSNTTNSSNNTNPTSKQDKKKNNTVLFVSLGIIGIIGLFAVIAIFNTDFGSPEEAPKTEEVPVHASDSTEASPPSNPSSKRDTNQAEPWFNNSKNRSINVNGRKIQVADSHYPQKLSYPNIQRILNDGWRLPTKAELETMYRNDYLDGKGYSGLWCYYLCLSNDKSSFAHYGMYFPWGEWCIDHAYFENYENDDSEPSRSHFVKD